MTELQRDPRVPEQRICQKCGTPITSLGRGAFRFCSAACRIAYREAEAAQREALDR